MHIRKTSLFVFFFNVAVILKAQNSNEYLHPKFDSITKVHKSIAILPFDVQLSYRPIEKKYISDSDKSSLQKQEGAMAQKTLDAFLFKKINKKKNEIYIQDIDSTNKLFRNNKWQNDSIIQKSMKDIAALLNVDAILYGVFKTNRPVSKEIATTFWNLTGMGILPNISGNCVMYLYDGSSGELLWKFKRNFDGGPNSNIDAEFEPIMKAISRRLPYF